MNFIFDKRIYLLGHYFSIFDLILLLALVYGLITIPFTKWTGFIILIIAVVVHEVAHGLMAYYLGDPTAKQEGRLSLNPFVHVDPLGTVVLPLILVVLGSPFLFGWAKPVPVIPRFFKNETIGMMWVALAGPISNIILALSAAQVIKVLVLKQYLNADHIIIELLLSAIIINLVLAVFNMIPIPPLDGSRVIMVMLPNTLRNWWYQLENYGLFIVMGLVYFGIFDEILVTSINILLNWILY